VRDSGVRGLGLARGVLVLLLPPLLAVSAVGYQQLAQERAPRRPAELAVMASGDPTARRLALQHSFLSDAAQVERLADRGAHGLQRLGAGERVVILRPRSRPYRVADLVALGPSVVMKAAGRLDVRLSLYVPRGAELDLAKPSVGEIRLLSSARRQASIVGLGGRIHLAGTAGARLVVTSWDPRLSGPDRSLGDGRAFLLNREGRMRMTRVHVRHLGFGTGITSGAAWVGDAGKPARGAVRHSVFSRNVFGAFTYRAEDMTWSRNIFARNVGYGFDPHDFSNDFLVVGNIARFNGRHGIIFSRGCNRNVLSENESYGNLGHGFMIDDGRSEGATARTAPVPSNDNVLRRNVARANGRVGIEIEGGVGNIVEKNRLTGNWTGLRFRRGASATASDNIVRDSSLYGVAVEAPVAGVRLTGNRVEGSWLDLHAPRGFSTDRGQFAIDHAESVAGGRRLPTDPISTFASYLRHNPGLIAWFVILLVPLGARMGTRMTRNRTAPSGQCHPAQSLRHG
jgi:parallel beta-helix repeat protein